MDWLRSGVRGRSKGTPCRSNLRAYTVTIKAEQKKCLIADKLRNNNFPYFGVIPILRGI